MLLDKTPLASRHLPQVDPSSEATSPQGDVVGPPRSRVAAQTVQLAVVDVDGCITAGEARAWNWDALRAIADFNWQAKQGRAVPAVTLCTGRQEPYVEVLMQAIDAFLPGIYENGGGLYDPATYRFVEHPSLTAQVKEALSEIRVTLLRQVVEPGLGYFQPGKETSLTLYPLPGIGVLRLHQAVASSLSGRSTGFGVQASASCVDVTLSGIDKGAGVRWLAEETGIALARMGGIGDSTSDLKFLRIVGRSASPVNAVADVRAAVDYVSAYEDGDGVVDILRYWCGR
jgi:hydroxymethylpyrimidine pyrophosphatase-like HAD family hydrolase